MKVKHIIALYFLSFLLIILNSCAIKSVFLGRPDNKDLKRFKNTTIKKGETCFEFKQDANTENASLMIEDWTRDIPFFMPIDTFAETHKIRSFLVIQNDSIKYQYYDDRLNENDLHSSYSVAKSFTSALIGIAIDEGIIKSEQDLVVDYLNELKDIPHATKLTIEHLLNHTSGIQYSLITDAIIYYGDNSMNALKKIKFEDLPGTKQHYLNINIQLLGIILRRVTGVSVSNYLQEKIWKPIQMCSDALWSVDKKNGLEKTYCCLGASALDYAKFGRLYLNKGMWEDERVISESWYNKSIKRDTTGGSSFNYNYCWYIGLKEYGDFMAIGLYKQHIYINPKKNLIIVLFNDNEKPLKAERVNWWHIFRQIADQL